MMFRSARYHGFATMSGRAILCRQYPHSGTRRTDSWPRGLQQFTWNTYRDLILWLPGIQSGRL
jgi:hypothetical protein